MFKNYLKTAYRHLVRQPGYTALNVIGLTIGITSSLIIVLYLVNELSYDKHHENADNIFRISSHITEPDDDFYWAVTQPPVGPKMQEEFAEVTNYVRFLGQGRTRLELDNINYYERQFYAVDSTVFDIFTFKFISGNPESALDAPNSIVLSKSVADRIFNGEEAVGKSLKWDGDQPLQVTGVYEDMPDNSHIIANGMISLNTMYDQIGNGWGGFFIYTYLVLDKPESAAFFKEKLDKVIKENVATIFDQFDIQVVYHLINIKDIHLYSNFEGEPTPAGDINYIYIFSAVLVFIILIASINYMNLATARSVKRATEVGIRKVMGAERGRLIGQFLSESIIISIISFIISGVLVSMFVPMINGALDTNLSLSTLLNGEIMVIVLLIVLITGFLGGSYPAFYLSSFLPATVLKGGGSSKSGNSALRKSLVVVQFAISIFMLIGTGIIYNQMNYVRNKDMGFDKDQVISFRLTNRQMREKWPVLKNKITTNPNVKSASTSSSSPGNGYGKNLMNIENNDGGMDQKGINSYRIDYDYFPTLDIKFTQGRNFSLDYQTDTASAVIVNQAMIDRMQWDEAIGKRIQIGTNDSLPYFKVIGVVEDFHQQSLYNLIEPMLFRPNFNNGIVLVKINDNVKETVASIKLSWEEVFPNIPFEHSFIDEQFLSQYEDDERRGNLFLGFSVMTIVIACMGLLGLASYTAEQRTKEISIRKVLGANTSGLINLLIKDFLILVLIGALPAFIAAQYFMSQWLENFIYNAGIQYWIFGVVLVITMIITVLSTGYFAMRAATANPAENLKYE